MKKFTLDIRLGNDDVQTSDDVARILIETATEIRAANQLAWLRSKSILDGNGNTVGQWMCETESCRKCDRPMPEEDRDLDMCEDCAEKEYMKETRSKR